MSMFSKKEKKTLTLKLQDENKSTYGIISLSPDDVYDVSYNGIKHNVLITLRSSFQRGMTTVELIQNEGVESNKRVKKPGYMQRELYNSEGYNHVVTIVDEAEMKSVWEWRGEDWTLIEKLREEILAAFEKAKADAKAREEEEKNKKEEGQEPEENNSGGSKLVNLHGEDLRKSVEKEAAKESAN